MNSVPDSPYNCVRRNVEDTLVFESALDDSYSSLLSSSMGSGSSKSRVAPTAAEVFTSVTKWERIKRLLGTNGSCSS